MFGSLVRNFTLRSRRMFLSFFGGDTWSGKAVTPETAMQVAAFWACVRLLSRTVAALPLGIYVRRADGGRDTATDHPLHALLHDQPNADDTAFEFWEIILCHLLLWGNGYAEKVYSGDKIVALNLLRPWQMHPRRDEYGALVYRYSDPKGVVEYSENEIFHLRGFSLDGDVGISVLAYGRQTIGSAIAAEEAAARTFANGMRPGGILTYEGKNLLTEQQREQAKKAFVEPITGAENAGKTLLLEGASGFKFQEVSMPAKDAELLASRAFSVEQIARLFGIPPILIGHASAGQTMWGSGVEQIMLGWLTLDLNPWLKQIEQTIKRSLLRPEERAQFYAEFTVEGLLRADSAGRAEMYSKLMQVGGITPNQIADRENLPRFEGGDRHFVNSTLVPLEMAGERPGRVQPAPGEPIPEE